MAVMDIAEFVRGDIPNNPNYLNVFIDEKVCRRLTCERTQLSVLGVAA